MQKGIYSLSFFLFACSNHRNQPTHFSGCVNAIEKEDLQQLFDMLLFKNYGAYVLFGSKPLCNFSIHNMDSPAKYEVFDKFWAELPQEKREKIEAMRQAQSEQEVEEAAKLENRYYAGWLAFQKLLKHFKVNGFLFRVLPLRCPDAYDVFFINIQQTALILAENYDIFKQAAGMDFDPLQIVFEAEDPNSQFWINVMSMDNHAAKGLLYGFGRKNSLFGQLIFSSKDEHYKSNASTDLVSQDIFDIPFFAAVSGDKTAEKYDQERLVIKKKYWNQDMVEVTLQRLFQPKLVPL